MANSDITAAVEHPSTDPTPQHICSSDCGTSLSPASRNMAPYLLDVVDLVVFAFLVACDLPLGLLSQVAHASVHLHALPHCVLHRLGESQPGLPHPLVQASVDWRTDRVRGTQGEDGAGRTHWTMRSSW